MVGSRIQFYHTDNGPCPYRTSGNWVNLAFQSNLISLDAYTTLLNQGFRRSGHSIYQPICNDCSSCIPLRVDVKKFQASRSQRKTWRKNQDLRIEHRQLGFCVEGFHLYRRYQENWHQSTDSVTETEYLDFLITSPVNTEMLYYYSENRLVGIGWIDVLPDLISSVYFIFEPGKASRRLGIFSILYEIEYCRTLKRPWLYLGYWVQDSHKMSYKSEFQPAQVLRNTQWIPFQQIRASKIEPNSNIAENLHAP